MNEAIARCGYTIAWFIGLPLVVGYLLWRSLRQREYRGHWRERFLGAGATIGDEGTTIWIHAVSVGETRAAQPLVERLAAAHPRARFVLTHVTPTGRAAGAAIEQALPGRVVQRYLPYELPVALKRFFRETRPRIGVVLETEIWPNLLHSARTNAIPIVLVNARLSEKSLARALRSRTLFRAAARAITRVGAQSEADRARLAQLYDRPIDVLGNLKFDLALDPAQLARGRALRARLARPVLALASSRDGEEVLLLDALARTMARRSSSLSPTTPSSDPVFLIVPRHPQRFDEVARLIDACGFGLIRRSEKSGSDHDFLAAFQHDQAGNSSGRPSGDPSGNFAAKAAGNSARVTREAPRNRRASELPRVLLGDSMGEMALYYATADLALMGGSFLPYGSQNLIESCAAGTPVVLGPSTYNFAQAARDALTAGAAIEVDSMDTALTVALEILGDPARLAAMREHAIAFAAAHRGATGRTVALLEQVLEGREASDVSNARGASDTRHQ